MCNVRKATEHPSFGRCMQKGQSNWYGYSMWMDDVTHWMMKCYELVKILLRGIMTVFKNVNLHDK